MLALTSTSSTVSYKHPTALNRRRRWLTTGSTFAGIDDSLVGRITAGLPSNYLLALTELYINFHGQSSLSTG